MPSRRDLDPCEIPQLLPYLILVDVFSDPPDFRYRLIGTQIVAQSRRDFTDQPFSVRHRHGAGRARVDACVALDAHVWLNDRLLSVDVHTINRTGVYAVAASCAVFRAHLSRHNDLA